MRRLCDVSGLDYAGSLSDPVAAVLFCGAGRRARHVLVNGKIVVEDERLALAEEKQLAREANRLSKEMLEKV